MTNKHIHAQTPDGNPSPGEVYDALITASLLALDALQSADPGNPGHNTGWASDESCEAYSRLWNALVAAGVNPAVRNTQVHDTGPRE